MSRDAGDPPPRTPKRRPKPPADDADEPTTFSPAPQPADPPRAPVGPPDRSPRAKREPREESGGPGFFERVVFGSVGAGHLAVFCRQAASYLDAGIDLV